MVSYSSRFQLCAMNHYWLLSNSLNLLLHILLLLLLLVLLLYPPLCSSMLLYTPLCSSLLLYPPIVTTSLPLPSHDPSTIFDRRKFKSPLLRRGRLWRPQQSTSSTWFLIRVRFKKLYSLSKAIADAPMHKATLLELPASQMKMEMERDGDGDGERWRWEEQLKTRPFFPAGF